MIYMKVPSIEKKYLMDMKEEKRGGNDA